jgi:uncharacterized damage-inducible protein DinB
MASERERFRRFYDRESGVTRKVLSAFPGHEAEFKPHDRSNSAKALASTFVIEQIMILKALKGEFSLGGGWPKTADTWDGLLAEFDAGRAEILSLLENSNNDELAGTIVFFTGPGETGDVPLADFVNFMTHDQIHHRGQLSVYLRMAGGKVPAIYGPSADEPWM